RRHTRFSRDWSSDVCSSDLPTHVSLAFELEIVESFREIYHTFYNETLLRRIVKDLAEFEAYGLGEFNPLAKQLLGAGFVRLLERSEERRVGKEWRSRWSHCL